MDNQPTVSIITVVRNGASTIEGAIESVLNQVYPNIEYIVIDGASTDDTLTAINKYKDKIAHIVSEPDKGIYDAMNKGICLAKGDVVGILNADDFYTDNRVIADVVEIMSLTNADVAWSNLEYVDKNDTSRVVRRWTSSSYSPGKFKNGWMPPHPTFFARRELYQKYGMFTDKLSIAADYELMLRFIERYHVRTCYIPRVMVKMRTGGASNRNLKNIIRANIESYRAWQMNGLHINPLRILLKPLSKIIQLFT